jgi:hypothetical protein
MSNCKSYIRTASIYIPHSGDNVVPIEHNALETIHPIGFRYEDCSVEDNPYGRHKILDVVIIQTDRDIQPPERIAATYRS